MNKTKLKNYAPAARRGFIRAVTDRAHLLGLSEAGAEPVQENGDVVLIGGHAYPAQLARQRRGLEARIRRDGFAQVMEAVAYTWFNRFAALRYMELHGYLEHGYRVLSHPNGGAIPEILEQAAELAQTGELPGLDREQVIQFKLAGNQDAELYRRLLVAQCNQLAAAMPFLFERIDDETELLLPDNLLHSDSLIRKLVTEIDADDWRQVEIIGWLYQFYISEKKDEVIGKVVKSEDIPAATQLFTPNWIVQYLVQNSVGRLWLMANPSSSLKSQWPYYIEPAEQTPEVQAQLDALIKTRMAEDGGSPLPLGEGPGVRVLSLNPETITVLDPACGSGHILVEAYEVLKGIYLERGYQARSIPRLILERNLFGLDIDDRAAQLAGFALLMKARADDRRLLETPARLNVLSLKESAGMDLDEFAGHLKPHGINRTVLGSLLDTFTQAKTFGSLIQIPKVLEDRLAGLEDGMAKAIENGDVFAKAAAQDLVPLVQQAKILVMRFDAVVANPPYMGSKAMNGPLKKFAKEYFPKFNSDLFSVSTERFLRFARANGFIALMTPFTWMFLKSYQELRDVLLENNTLQSLIQPEYHAFFDSAFVPVCIFVTQSCHIYGFKASFIRLSDFYGADVQSTKTLEAISDPNCTWLYRAKPDDFKKVPGSPLAYWIGTATRSIFSACPRMESICEAQAGLSTTDNETFLRLWWEVSNSAIKWNAVNSEDAKLSRRKWFPHNKGGKFRKWYGNQEYVVDWEDDGRRIKHSVISKYPYLNGNPNFVVHDYGNYFKPTVSWSEITSGPIAFRYYPAGLTFSNKGMSAFPKPPHSLEKLLSLCNSKIIAYLSNLLNPSLSFGTGNFYDLPPAFVDNPIVEQQVNYLIKIAQSDWDAYESSWNFQVLPMLFTSSGSNHNLETSYSLWITQNRTTIAEMRSIEEENNRIYIDAYGLSDELTPEVPLAQITLTANPAYRYGGNLTEDEQWSRFRQDTMTELISYAIGCMMGRYSLDERGLIYADAGNVGFDATRYKTFPADADGIIPITDELWFEDDAANRIREFLLAVWPVPTLDENMAWLAESLGTKGNETPAETIRRYLASSFFKDHLQTYKKRPIYWLFSSGKQGAFQALVYLHRYHEGTLARMRAEYVVPLQGKLAARIAHLQDEVAAAPSTAARNKLQKQLDALKKKQAELIAYDEQLRHYADQRSALDLDDGVKVNYGKFGNLLAEVKTVTGGFGDD